MGVVQLLMAAATQGDNAQMSPLTVPCTPFGAGHHAPSGVSIQLTFTVSFGALIPMQ